MSDDDQKRSNDDQSGTAVLTRPARPRARTLPRWQVLLHNDDVNDVIYVIRTVMQLTRLPQPEATVRTIEAHQRGLSLLLSTHREHAELLQEQFQSKKLTVTIEPE